MKKINQKSIFAIILTLLLLFSFGCNKGEDKSDNKSNGETKRKNQIVSKTITNPLTGEGNLSADAMGKRPIAVVVNNAPPARPQWGLCTPDIVIEGLVEAGITRMLWLYSDVNEIPKVGSVRSARHDFIEIAEGFDSVFVHWGGSEYAYSAIKNRNIKTIDGISLGKYFARDSSRKVSKEHTGYTTGQNIKQAIADQSIRSDIQASYATPFKFNSNTATYASGSCNSIKLSFSKGYNHTFNYNSSDKLYYNNLNANKMVDADGKQMAITNVIILYFPSYTVLNSAGSIDMNLSGGKGVIASNGSYENISWEKGNTPSSMIKLYAQNGSELKLNVGKSYIALVPANNSGSTVIS